jgi:outer membrane protein TolC
MRFKSSIYLASFYTMCYTASLVRPAAAAPAEPPPRLSLSMAEAVDRALAANVDLAQQRLRPPQAEERVKEAQGAYDVQLGVNASYLSENLPVDTALAGAPPLDTQTMDVGVSLERKLDTGGSVRLGFDSQRSSTNAAYALFDPAYRSGLSLRVQQPLLRDRAIDADRERLRRLRKEASAADLELQDVVSGIRAEVRRRYYDLIAAIDAHRASETSLELARALLTQNRSRVAAGAAGSLEIAEAEAEMATRLEDVIVADAAVRAAEDGLKRLILPRDAEASLWRARIVPTDPPSADRLDLDVEAAVTRALDGRLDIAAARRRVEAVEISAGFLRDQSKARVDLVASYATAGLDGTELIRDTFGGPVRGTVSGGYGDAVRSAFGQDHRTWTVGVNVSHAIGNRRGKALAARGHLEQEDARAELRRLEMDVIAEVREAARGVETGFQRLEATRAAHALQVERLRAEERRREAGMSTTFLVTQAQRDLALAEVAEIRAVADYGKSLVELERVQTGRGRR